MSKLPDAREPTPAPDPIGGITFRPIAIARDWSITEYVCTSGPESRAFEERHEDVSISAVLGGSFTYRSASGRALLHPGALLLGNAGAHYECGHDHSQGDRCVALHLSPAYFAEIAASAAGSSDYRFAAAMLPASRAVLPQTAFLEAIAPQRDPLGLEESVARFVACTACALSGHVMRPQSVSALDVRRISRALRYIEANAMETLDLDQLASVAAMSKFHFLRVFNRAVGVTPYQFVLGVRLRRAAWLLRTSDAPILEIALASGFGDLSTFNATFRSLFGATPSAYRHAASSPAPARSAQHAQCL